MGNENDSRSAAFRELKAHVARASLNYLLDSPGCVSFRTVFVEHRKIRVRVLPGVAGATHMRVAFGRPADKLTLQGTEARESWQRAVSRRCAQGRAFLSPARGRNREIGEKTKCEG